MSRAVLAFEGVSYRYPGASDAALRDVSVELHAGEFCVLAGLSGSGKSTLLRAACGLVPHFHGGDFAGRARRPDPDRSRARPDAFVALPRAVVHPRRAAAACAWRAKR